MREIKFYILLNNFVYFLIINLLFCLLGNDFGLRKCSDCKKFYKFCECKVIISDNCKNLFKFN